MTSFVKFFTENIGLKLLSLALAVAIWNTVGGDPVTETTLRVPVEFRNMPANLELMTTQTEVELRVRGPSRALRRATSGDFSVQVNLQPRPQFGEQTYAFRTNEIQTPTFVKVVQLIPAQIRFTLEPTATKQVPIHPQFSGEVAPNQQVKSFRLRPPQATIAGPRSRVEPFQTVLTDPVDLTALATSKTFHTTIYVPDPLVRLVDSSTVEVTVTLEKAE